MDTRTSLKTRMGRVVLHTAIQRRAGLLAAVAISIASAARAQSTTEPYSILNIRLGPTTVRSLDQLHRYYPGNSGFAVEIESPFEFGQIGIVLDAVNLRGATPQQPEVHTKVMAFDW